MTQRQIAEKLGISQTTVSMVINDPLTSKVSSEKRQQIMNYLRQTKYLLRNHGGKTWNIGYLIGDIVDLNNPFYNRFFTGIEKSAADAGYNVIIERYRQGKPKLLGQHKVDGIIIEVKPYAMNILEISSTFPAVLLDNSCNEIICDTVTSDITGGMFKSIKYLKDLGHKVIAFIDLTTPYKLYNVNQIEVRDGFRAAWKFYFPDHPIAEEYIKTPCIKEKDSIPATEETISQILEDFWAMPDRPTAVICGDVYAKILIRKAHERGIKIPGQLSIIGLDNTIECEYCIPPLTSVDYNNSEMGRLAVELLFRRISDPERSFVKQHCDSKLIVRKSSDTCLA